jgi:hypothetical protein
MSTTLRGLKNRYRREADGVGVALAIHFSLYSFVSGLFALWLYSLMQPKLVPNPGLAAYKPPPGTVISYEVPARSLVQHGQPPTLAELPSTLEADETTGRSAQTAEQAPEPQRGVKTKKPKPPKVAAPPRERRNSWGLMQRRIRHTGVIGRSERPPFFGVPDFNLCPPKPAPVLTTPGPQPPCSAFGCDTETLRSQRVHREAGGIADAWVVHA